MSDLDRRLESIAGDDEWARHQALEALCGEHLTPNALARLVGDLGREDASRRTAARTALATLASTESASQAAAQEALRAGLGDDDAGRRGLAASALGEAGDQSAGAPLIEALQDPDPNVQAAAADALGELRHAPALDALAELSQSDDLWVRAAAVVALGRLRDHRAIPVLERLADSPGLEKAVIEALGRINRPAALPLLRKLSEAAPRPALRTAGAILSANPDNLAPEWVRSEARSQEEVLIQQLVAEDSPAVARLLGLAGTRTAVDTLISLAGPPRRSEAALGGLLAAPVDVRTAAIFERLSDADERETQMLLAALPPLRDEATSRALLPFLTHEASAVRSAAAEALARSPRPDVFGLLQDQIERDPAPELIRATGGLGEVACASLVPLLSDPSASVRAAAASALSRCAGQGIERDLRDALGAEAESRVREALVQALARAAGPEAMDVVEEALTSDRADTRIAAIHALGMIGDAAAVPGLGRALERDPAERLAALEALGVLGEAAGAPLVARHVTAEDRDVRRAAARAAVRLGRAMDPAVAATMAADEDPWVRACAARVLAHHRGSGADRLGELAREDPDPEVRAVARQILEPGGG